MIIPTILISSAIEFLIEPSFLNLVVPGCIVFGIGLLLEVLFYMFNRVVFETHEVNPNPFTEKWDMDERMQDLFVRTIGAQVCLGVFLFFVQVPFYVLIFIVAVVIGNYMIYNRIQRNYYQDIDQLRKDLEG